MEYTPTTDDVGKTIRFEFNKGDYINTISLKQTAATASGTVTVVAPQAVGDVLLDMSDPAKQATVAHGKLGYIDVVFSPLIGCAVVFR